MKLTVVKLAHNGPLLLTPPRDLKTHKNILKNTKSFTLGNFVEVEKIWKNQIIGLWLTFFADVENRWKKYRKYMDKTWKKYCRNDFFHTFSMYFPPLHKPHFSEMKMRIAASGNCFFVMLKSQIFVSQNQVPSEIKKSRTALDKI